MEKTQLQARVHPLIKSRSYCSQGLRHANDHLWRCCIWQSRSSERLAVYLGLEKIVTFLSYRRPTWKIIEITNKSMTPGQRYGHTMVFNKPYLVVFGGNSGNKAENDVWLLNINKGPFQWQRYEFQSKICPSPRVYHSAAICE